MTGPTSKSVLSAEIMRYQHELCDEDYRDPIHPSYWRSPRAMFLQKCARAWRDFAVALEKIERGVAE